MQIETFIATAKAQGASDLHLEAGLPAALRVRGSLKTLGEPVPAKALVEIVGKHSDVPVPKGMTEFVPAPIPM